LRLELESKSDYSFVYYFLVEILIVIIVDPNLVDLPNSEAGPHHLEKHIVGWHELSNGVCVRVVPVKTVGERDVRDLLLVFNQR
jgi:DNA-directed RNA polymerase subunit E'/Rpb7